jgi:NADPH:quinone reductase-like Zn-dependent oxidoreductase
MKAARINEYGHADAIQIANIDQPEAGEGQVVIEVHGSSINPFDSVIREGLMQKYIPLKLPVTLGGDIAGIVRTVGQGVDAFAVGDRVYGQANVASGASGAFAEYAVTAASQVGLMPAKLDFVQAGALPLVGVSALQAINGHIQLQPGEKILIHGGAGGIGSIAIQIAKYIGAYVATTATGADIDYVRQLGADEVIDYKTQAFDEILHDYDAVFDTVAGQTYDLSFKVVKKNGIIVSMNARPNNELMEQYGVVAIAQQTRVTTELLNQLTQLVDQDVVTPHVNATFSLTEIQQAFAAREAGEVRGKIAIKIQ